MKKVITDITGVIGKHVGLGVCITLLLEIGMSLVGQPNMKYAFKRRTHYGSVACRVQLFMGSVYHGVV